MHIVFPYLFLYTVFGSASPTTDIQLDNSGTSETLTDVIDVEAIILSPSDTTLVSNRPIQEVAVWEPGKNYFRIFARRFLYLLAYTGLIGVGVGFLVAVVMLMQIAFG
jgi:hypothetical protein